MGATTKRHWPLVLAMLIALGGCATGSSPGGAHIKNIGKSDINMVADMHYQQVNQLLRKLMIKLYKRNPDQLAKSRRASIRARVGQLFDHPGKPAFAELDGVVELEAMYLAMDPAFGGDRVFALMTGLKSMLDRSYNNQSEFYLLSESLDEDKLYKSARNIEILVWMLSHRVDENGRMLLLTNNLPGEKILNLSFERLFGKLIALQDMMANITAQKNQRFINKVVYNVASMAFLPF